MSEKTNFNRRDFMKSAGAGLALAGILGGAQADEPAKAPAVLKSGRTPDGAPSKIIFMVADGMSWAVPTMAEALSQKARGKGLHLTRLLNEPGTVQGLFETFSLNSLVTDSAAASTAWGSGTRVLNGSINTLPDGTKMTPIAHLVRDAGKKMGLVTTTTITHATPAGFASVQAHRDDQHLIAPQYLDMVDVLMGGGQQFYLPNRRADKRDLLGEYKKAGYTAFDHRDQVLKMPGTPEKVIGLFADGHIPFTVDRNNSSDLTAKVPTLAEMSEAALKILNQSPNGFLLQIEGGRVDHGGHANDIAGSLWDMIAFDDAIGVVLDFVDKNPDTLVVITSDHGTANPGLNGMGSGYKDTNECFERVLGLAGSHESIEAELGAEKKKNGSVSPDHVASVLKANCGIDFKGDEIAAVTSTVNGKPPADLNHTQRNFAGIMGQVLGNYTGFFWTSVNHTSDYMMIASVGTGSEAFTGLHKNIEGFDVMTKYLGTNFRNPKMTWEDAKKFQAYVPTRRLDDWA